MDKVRFALIKILNQKFKVSLIVLNRGEINESHVDTVKDICNELIIINDRRSLAFNNLIIKKLRTLYLILASVFFHAPVFVSSDYSYRLKREIKNLLKSRTFDIIQPLSDYSINYVIDLHTDSYKLFGPNDDMVGMTNSILAVTENIFKRQLLKIELSSRKKWQEKIISKANKVLYFSKADIENIIIRNPVLKEKLVWMPGVVEYQNEWNESSIYSVEKNTIIFTGGLISEFNRLSIIYFLKKIWPSIVQEVRDVKLYIVGQCAGDSFQKKHSFDNVIYTGKVQEVRPYLERAAVFISPVTCGTGIKTKIVEAMRFGKPIVSTPEGISGLWEYQSDAIKIESNPLDFSAEVVKLLKDDKYRIESCLKSRELFEKHYSYNALVQRIYDIYYKI